MPGRPSSARRIAIFTRWRVSSQQRRATTSKHPMKAEGKSLDITCGPLVYLLTNKKHPYNFIYAVISALIQRGGGKRPYEAPQPSCKVAGKVPIPAEYSAR